MALPQPSSIKDFAPSSVVDATEPSMEAGRWKKERGDSMQETGAKLRSTRTGSLISIPKSDMEWRSIPSDWMASRHGDPDGDRYNHFVNMRIPVQLVASVEGLKKLPIPTALKVLEEDFVAAVQDHLTIIPFFSKTMTQTIRSHLESGKTPNISENLNCPIFNYSWCREIIVDRMESELRPLTAAYLEAVVEYFTLHGRNLIDKATKYRTHNLGLLIEASYTKKVRKSIDSVREHVNHQFAMEKAVFTAHDINLAANASTLQSLLYQTLRSPNAHRSFIAPKLDQGESIEEFLFSDCRRTARRRTAILERSLDWPLCQMWEPVVESVVMQKVSSGKSAFENIDAVTNPDPIDAEVDSIRSRLAAYWRVVTRRITDKVTAEVRMEFNSRQLAQRLESVQHAGEKYPDDVVLELARPRRRGEEMRECHRVLSDALATIRNFRQERSFDGSPSFDVETP